MDKLIGIIMILVLLGVIHMSRVVFTGLSDGRIQTVVNQLVMR